MTVALKVAPVPGDSRLLRHESASLGIYANTVNRETQKPAKTGTSYRLHWKAQRAAQGLLREFRVSTCNRRRKGEHVRLLRRIGTSQAHFNGLETCGSVWHCPICSARITERRRIELQAAIDAWVKRGGEVYLMTLTFPHDRADDLHQLERRQAAALKRFKNSKGYKSIMADAGRLGSIRALEITWGAWHGWHPHTHDLVFAERGALPKLQALRALWIDAVIAEGLAIRSQLNDLIEAAFDVQNGDYAAEYVAKFGFEPALKSKIEAGEVWGAAREMTQGMVKGGTVKRLKGKTPFTLLREYVEGNKQSGALFAEFGRAFKGKRQLFWSPKLRQVLGLGEEKTDDELATVEDLQPTFEQVAALDKTQWDLVISHDARGELLHWAGIYGADGVAVFLGELRARPPTHQSADTASKRWG